MKKSTYMTIYKKLLKTFIKKEDHIIFNSSYGIHESNGEIIVQNYENLTGTLDLYILICKSYLGDNIKQSESNISNVINSKFDNIKPRPYDIMVFDLVDEKKELKNILETSLYYR